MLAGVAGAVQPPDLAIGVFVRQGPEHGEHRRRADAGADQEHRRGRLVEDERTPRRGGLQLVADGRTGVHETAARAVGASRLTLMR